MEYLSIPIKSKVYANNNKLIILFMQRLHNLNNF